MKKPIKQRKTYTEFEHEFDFFKSVHDLFPLGKAHNSSKTLVYIFTKNNDEKSKLKKEKKCVTRSKTI